MTVTLRGMQVEYRRVFGVRTYHVMVVTPDADELTPQLPHRVRNNQLQLATLAQPRRPTIEAVVFRSFHGLDAPRERQRTDDHRLHAWAYHLSRIMAEVWSPLLAQDLLAIIRVELRSWELKALRAGCWRLRQALEDESQASDVAVAHRARCARRCLNDAMAFWGVSLTAAIEEWLPRQLEALERRRFERSRAVTEPLPHPPAP